MNLSMHNNGKTLTQQYCTLRQQGVIDKTRLSDAQQEWVELQPGEGNGQYNPITYQTDIVIPQGFFSKTIRVSAVDKSRGIIDVGDVGGLDGGNNSRN
ncbi:MAG: hypothetical protein WC936_06110 [Candidatus Nanoarchaeia archaeon]|jgi:hypothetical protein